MMKTLKYDNYREFQDAISFYGGQNLLESYRTITPNQEYHIILNEEFTIIQEEYTELEKELMKKVEELSQDIKNRDTLIQCFVEDANLLEEKIKLYKIMLSER